jgi:rod shape-determining protein MreD
MSGRFVRWAPLALALAITQVAVFPGLRMLGVVPDLGLLGAIAVAWNDEPESGAWFAFGAGLFVDCFVTTPLGLTALSWAVVAYALGMSRDVVHRHLPVQSLVLGFVGGLAAGSLFAVLAILVGADAVQQAHTVRIVLASALYDALLAPFVFGLVRLLGPRAARLRGLR